jgi:hypothetical protein
MPFRSLVVERLHVAKEGEGGWIDEADGLTRLCNVQ